MAGAYCAWTDSVFLFIPKADNRPICILYTI